MRLIVLIAMTGLAACADVPQLDDRIGEAARAADYPTLLPLDPLLAAAAANETAGQITPASVAAFDSRIATLRARAARIRGPVIDGATRRRMQRGVAIPAAIR